MTDGKQTADACRVNSLEIAGAYLDAADEAAAHGGLFISADAMDTVRAAIINRTPEDAERALFDLCMSLCYALNNSTVPKVRWDKGIDGHRPDMEQFVLTFLNKDK